MNEWRPYQELRFVVPQKTTTEPPKLQQLWIKDKLNGWGHVIGYVEEWRDVPTVVLADEQ